MKTSHAAGLILGATLIGACLNFDGPDGASDDFCARRPDVCGTDALPAGQPDSGTIHAGSDAGSDAGSLQQGRDGGSDAGSVQQAQDAGSDAGTAQQGTDAGSDAGTTQQGTDAGNTGGPPPTASGTFDPTRIYMYGGMAGSNSSVIADVFHPTEARPALPVADSFLIHPASGKLFYVAASKHQAFEYVPDDFIRDSGQWDVPYLPEENDRKLDGSVACGSIGASAVHIAPDTGVVMVACGGGKVFTEAGEAVPLPANHYLTAVGNNGFKLTSDTNGVVLLDADNQRVPLTGDSKALPSWIFVSHLATPEGFLLFYSNDAQSRKDVLYEVKATGEVTFLGTYAAVPPGYADGGDTEALLAADRSIWVQTRDSNHTYDVVVQRPLASTGQESRIVWSQKNAPADPFAWQQDLNQVYVYPGRRFFTGP